MDVGLPEVLVILAIALLIFGPSKIPELGKALGSSIREFRAGLQSGAKNEKSHESDTHPS